MKIVPLVLIVVCAACAAPPKSETPSPQPAPAADAAEPATPPAAPVPLASAEPAPVPSQPSPPSAPVLSDTAETADIPTRLGLPGLVAFCAGNVPAVPRDGQPASDVAWAAFVSRDGRPALGEHFDALFGHATYLRQGDCDAWRFPPQRPTSLLQICDPRLDGPWSTCGAPPPGTGAVLMVSELAGPQS